MTDSIQTLAQNAAAAVIEKHQLSREDGEPALSAFGWNLGESITYEQGLVEIVRAALNEVNINDLIEAKIELLTEHKLDYPGDYEPADIVRMHDEINRLRQLQAELND